MAMFLSIEPKYGVALSAGVRAKTKTININVAGENDPELWDALKSNENKIEHLHSIFSAAVPVMRQHKEYEKAPQLSMAVPEAHGSYGFVFESEEPDRFASLVQELAIEPVEMPLPNPVEVQYTELNETYPFLENWADLLDVLCDEYHYENATLITI